MSDTVHDDRLAKVFTQFRAEVREEIRPPGTRAARQAGRRRRTVRVAALAVTLALVGAVAGIVTTTDKPARYPPLSTAELEELGAQAFRVLERENAGGGFSTTVTTRTRDEPYTLGVAGSPSQFMKGWDYDLVARCAGHGTVIVNWAAPGGPTGTVPVVCGGDTVRVRFYPEANGGHVQIRLTPDAGAIDRSAIAVGFVEFR